MLAPFAALVATAIAVALAPAAAGPSHRCAPNGDLETVTDAAGNVTTYGAYDAHGRPGTMTDANGLVTAMTYDERGRLTTSSAGGETTRYGYDALDRLKARTYADESLGFTYDEPAIAPTLNPFARKARERWRGRQEKGLPEEGPRISPRRVDVRLKVRQPEGRVGACPLL